MQNKQKLVIKRTNTIIKHNLVINGVVKTPSKTISVNNVIIHQQPPAYNPASTVKSNPQKVVSTKNQLTRPKKKSGSIVKYGTNDIDIDSHAKIRRIQGIGSGKVLIIIANGPSINEVDFKPLLHNDKIHTLSVNHPDLRIWPTTYWAFFDVSQMRRHGSLWDDYNGYIFNSTSIKKQKTHSIQFKNLGVEGFSRDLSKGFCIGRSSVYASMQIAYWMGYDNIYIFGCDMDINGVDGKLHFYGTNPDVNPADRAQRFINEAAHYDRAATILTPQERSKYWFASSYNKWSFVDKFNKIDHRSAIEHILSTL